MQIEAREYHLDFSTGLNTQVESYQMHLPFVLPRPAERVHLHKSCLPLDVTDVAPDFEEREGSSLRHVVKIYGTEVSSVE